MLIDRYMQMLREEAEYDLYDEAEYDLYDEAEGESYNAYKARIIERNNKKDPFGGGKLQKIKKVKKPLSKNAKIGLGVAAGAAAAGGAALALKKHRDKKAKEVAVEEGVSLEEAFEYVLECEQILLDEGYEFEDIYNTYDEAECESYNAYKARIIERNNKKDPFGGGKLQKIKKPRKPLSKNAKIGLGVAAGAAAAGGAALALKKHRDKKAKEVAVEEGVSLEEAMMWILEVEQEYLNEGYDFEDIYGDWE